MENAMRARRYATMTLLLGLLVGAGGVLGAEAPGGLAARARSALAADPQLATRGAVLTVEAAESGLRLSGTVRFYSDKLHSERLVREIIAEQPLDTAVRVVPLMPASDREIERAIVGVGKLNRFQGARLQIAVTDGSVWVRGVFHEPRDVLFLTEQIAAIEGVRALEIDALYPV
jgi:F0F1-type ATP synthase membrane subunit c/vacuolar-type H+-ATPase subunit K